MARRAITIEEKISRKEEEVFKLKKRYEEALEELNTLVKQKKEAETKAVAQAFQESGKTAEEVIAWMKVSAR